MNAASHGAGEVGGEGKGAGGMPVFSAAVAAGGSVGSSEDVGKAVSWVLGGNRVPRRDPVEIGEVEWASLRKGFDVVIDRRTESLVKAAVRFAEVPDRVLAILKKASIQLTRSGFGDGSILDGMRGTVAEMVRTGGPVVMGLLLGGGKVANPLKTGGRGLPDLSEWHALAMFGAIARAIGAVHPAGARILVTPDAFLHGEDLGLPANSARAHRRQLEADLGWLGVEGQVFVPDVTEILDESWDSAVAARAREIAARLRVDAAARQDALGQADSLQYSLNTEVLGLTDEELILVYGAMAGQLRGIPAGERRLAADLFARAWAVIPHYIAVNHRIRLDGLVGRIARKLFGSERHLRLSVHAKPGEPRPALFEPGHLVPGMGLLPMHGTGVVETGAEFGAMTFGIAFDLSARMRGWAPLTRGGRFLGYRVEAGEGVASVAEGDPGA